MVNLVFTRMYEPWEEQWLKTCIILLLKIFWDVKFSFKEEISRKNMM
jgi:hypothetical protein